MAVVPIVRAVRAGFGSGGVKCWGNGHAFGIAGANSERTAPVDVSGWGAGVATIAAGFSHTCAIASNGAVTCIGGNVSGQVGDGADREDWDMRDIPVNVVGLSSGVKAIGAGLNFTCALMTSGGVKCWGSNDRGRLGGGGPILPTQPFEPAVGTSSVPVDVVGLR